MKTCEQFPRFLGNLPTAPTFVALREDVAYYSDGARMDCLSLEVIGDNIEQANAWVAKNEASGYTQRAYRIFKLIPATIQRTVILSVHEQA